jgi:hypothetical protein
MPKMMVSPVRLSELLKPQGFRLSAADARTKDISFVRESSIPRLFEHIVIAGQGKLGEVVYAKTAVSGSTGHSHDECVSAIDRALVDVMETDKARHWTLLRTDEEAKAWETKLARHADAYCRATTRAKGPSLHERLQPTFDAVDAYLRAVGDVFAVFDSEFRYLTSVPQEHKDEVDRYASLIGNIGEEAEDVLLACDVLFRHAPEIEGSMRTIREKKWHKNPAIRARVFLLTDFFREQRKLYIAAQGVRGRAP